MRFRPKSCPHAECPSHSGSAFTWRRRGAYERLCDHRVVPRFECLTCNRGFSEQTFRFNYRLKRPELLALFFVDRISKVTHRQSARNHACARSTEERQFRKLGAHCAAFHEARMKEVATRGGLGEVFLLDELETYEQNRLEKPVTVPILIERDSGFVLDTRVGALPARRLRGKPRKPPLPGQPERRSESRKVVKQAFECLRAVSPKDKPLSVLTDCKTSYEKILRQLFGKRCNHLRTVSTRRRDVSNPLWPINHTLARVRDNVSRLVRETWAASKLRKRLAAHLAIWTCYRNYVRGRTNREPRNTPAMFLGVQEQPWGVGELLNWRVFPAA